MKLLLESETALRLVEGEEPELAIEPVDPDTHLSPFHFLAASLATCTWSVLASWAEKAGLSVAGLELGVSWSLEDGRVARMDTELVWPDLPDERRAAAARAAHLCAIHETLQHPVAMEVRLADPDGGAGS